MRASIGSSEWRGTTYPATLEDTLTSVDVAVTYVRAAVPCKTNTDALARELIDKAQRIAANTLGNVSPPAQSLEPTDSAYASWRQNFKTVRRPSTVASLNGFPANGPEGLAAPPPGCQIY